MLTRPPREVVLRPAGYSVEPSVGAPFTTTDPVLAASVAAEWDRTDPRPFPEHDCAEETVELMSWASTVPIARTCRQCGEAV